MIKFISNRPIFLSLFLIFSCEKNENPMASINTVDSPILFAQCYVNHAWGYQYSGWYVDKTGWIYEVDKNATIKLDDVSQDTIFTERLMIDLLHSSSRTTKQIDEQILSEMKKLIEPASLGQLSESKSICRDFGALCYFTFIRNPEEKGYEQILLFQAGDWAQKNLSYEASELFKLLRVYVEDDTTQLPCSP